MEIKIFESEAAFETASAQFLSDSAHAKSPAMKRFALSGGRTPWGTYKIWRNDTSLNWDTIEIFQVDERYVQSDDADSNQRELLQFFPNAHVFNIKLPIKEAVTIYGNTLFDLKEHPFDCVVLGIGKDGHIASLFPKSAALKEDKYFAAHTVTNQATIVDRLTLTPLALLLSRRILVLVKGKGKEGIIEKLQDLSQDSNEFPAALLHQHPNVTVHFLRA